MTCLMYVRSSKRVSNEAEKKVCDSGQDVLRQERDNAGFVGLVCMFYLGKQSVTWEIIYMGMGEVPLLTA